MITVFYDGKCGLCSREIAHYRAIAPEGVFSWQDVSDSRASLQAMGVSVPDALKRLHAMDATGSLHIGVDAFILIWRQLASWRALAWGVSLPIVKSLAGVLYGFFADWRFKRLAHCQIST